MPKNPSKGGRDNFPTPQIYADEAVRHALTYLPTAPPAAPGVKGLHALEPGCGANAPFIRAFKDQVPNGTGVCIEKEWWKAPTIQGITPCTGLDFLDDTQDHVWNPKRGQYDLICTNPPFSVCEKFLEKCFKLLKPEGVMVYLLRLPVLGGFKRMHIWENRPAIEVTTFVRRISFDGEGTDYSEYGLFYWLGTDLDERYRKSTGQNHMKFSWIDNTSKQLKDGGLRPFGM